MVPFLYSKAGVIPKELCKKFIDTFEISTIKKEVDSRLSDGSIHKKSTDIYFENDLNTEWHAVEGDLWLPLIFEINSAVNSALSEYYNLYPELNLAPPVDMVRFNMQKYKPGEGFAGWHFDKEYNSRERVLVWMIYLNTVQDGGTEFKYQKHLEKAEESKLLIWPADWTFTHRGQISNSNAKYILTGWFESMFSIN